MAANKRATVGKIVSDNASQKRYETDPIELERAMHADYSRNVLDCFHRGRDCHDGSFYIVVTTKREPLMPDVIRHYFFHRSSCPTPDYDQTVYHYKHEDDFIDFLWTIPSKDACMHLKENATSVAPDEWALLNFVLKFADGTLFKLAKKLNNEKDDSSELVK